MKFHKSYTNRMMFGVCGGLGETFGINPNIIRIVLVLLYLTTRLPLYLLYLLLAFILPYGQAGGDGEEDSFGDPGRESSRDYTPDAPPFDVSGAKDVEIDDRNKTSKN